MSTGFAGNAKYVGRVGALAVALGIGAAVASGLGVAVAGADPGPDASSSDSTDVRPKENPKTTDATSTPPTDPPTSGGDTAEPSDPEPTVPDMKSSNTGGAHNSEIEPETPARQPHSPKKRKPPAASSPTSRTSRQDTPAATAKVADGEAPKPKVSAAPPAQDISETDTPQATMAVHVQESALRTAPAPPATVQSPVVTKVLDAVLSPLLAPGPGGPADTPLAWGLLAWVRGQGERSLSSRTSVAPAQVAATEVVDPEAATFSIAAVAAVNNAPTARDITFKNIPEDSALSSTVALSVTDADGDGLTARVINQPAHGTVEFYSNVGFIYRTAPDFNGSDSFTYRVNDGTDDSNTATVTINIAAVNDPPVANTDTATTAEDTPIRIDVKANDTDVDSTTLTPTVVTKPAHGTAVRNTDGTFTYTPVANYHGADSFTYKLYDGKANSATATVAITVTSVNDTPTAGNDNVTTKEDTAVTVNVLANDKDTDGDSLTTAVLTGPANGTVVHNANGSFTYAPTANYNGTDTFTYRVNDGTTDSAAATVTVRVTAVNDAPTANNDTATTAEDTPVRIDVKTNDTDVDSATFTPTVVAKPAHGTVVRNSDGTFTYTPTANFSGIDSFTYRDFDGAVNSATATVSITVAPGNDAPTATNDKVTTKEDTAVTINVLTNDKDGDGDSLNTEVVTDPGHGTVVHNANGSFTYTPTADYNGTDTFTYRVDDGTVSSTPATVTVTITAVNDAPVANDDTASTRVGTPVTIDVKANDTDVEGNALTPVVVTKPARGTVVRNTDGTFTYTPSANFSGVDTFTYREYDGANSASATVTITVTANQAPHANNLFFNNVPIPGGSTLSSYVNNDISDPDGDTLTASVVDQPLHGTVEFFSDGHFFYHAPTDYTGSDVFTYKVNDGTLDSNTATITIGNIVPANHAPHASDDTIDMPENAGIAVNLQNSSSDADGDPLTGILVSTTGHGTLNFFSNRTFNYVPDHNYVGTDTFTYKVNDGTADSNVATVTINITAVNEAPIAFDDALTIPEDSINSISVRNSSYDPDGDPLTGILVGGPSHGDLDFRPDRTFTYTPDADFIGQDSFTYKVSDGSLESNTVRFTFTITSVNDAPVALDDNYTTNVNVPVNTNPLGNDSDADYDGLTTIVVTPPAHGTLTTIPNGTIIYSPALNYVGQDSYTYKLNDGQLDSNVATVTITVNAVNHAPVAQDRTITITRNSGLGATLVGAYSDADGDAVTWVLVSGATTLGTVTLFSNGGFTYVAHGVPGTDSFTYKVIDSHGLDSNVATVTLILT